MLISKEQDQTPDCAVSWPYSPNNRLCATIGTLQFARSIYFIFNIASIFLIFLHKFYILTKNRKIVYLRRSTVVNIYFEIMKKFRWNDLLYASIVVCMVSAMIFFCGFLTANMEKLQEYHQTVLNAFAWVAVAGSALFYFWAARYVLGWLANVLNYYRFRFV